MGSPPRIEEIGAVYHVNTVAVAGLMAFPNYYHRDMFMRMFGFELEQSAWECLGYTVLGTHYHVAVRLTELTLSSGFQRLNSRYARWFNAEHGRRGALWQSRFFDAVVETEWHLLELQRYIAYNAPRANLAERPEDWPHCSYGALIGLYPPDPWVDEDEVLAAFGRNKKQARARLRAFVEERDPRVRRRWFLRGSSEDSRRTGAR
jgi:putative transposase